MPPTDLAARLDEMEKLVAGWNDPNTMIAFPVLNRYGQIVEWRKVTMHEHVKALLPTLISLARAGAKMREAHDDDGCTAETCDLVREWDAAAARVEERA